MIRNVAILILIIAIAGPFQAAFAEGAPGLNDPAILKDVGFDQHLDAAIPLDLMFADESGKAVKLGDYFGGRPVILVLAYYRCPMLCTLLLNGLVQGMRDLPFTPGKDFEIVTVSFDPRETSDLAAKKKKNYVGQYGRRGAAEAWHFLTGKADTIERLAHAVGFRYVFDPVQDQYIHTSGIVILTPDGKVSRYFFGIRFPGHDLRLGLIEASQGKIGTPADQALLYCFHYDPALGKYSASVLNVVRAGGVLTLMLLVVLVWYLRRREPQLSRTEMPSKSLSRVPYGAPS